MATLTNAAGAVATVPDTEVDFYRGQGWHLEGEAPEAAPRKTAAKKKTHKPSDDSAGDDKP